MSTDNLQSTLDHLASEIERLRAEAERLRAEIRRLHEGKSMTVEELRKAARNAGDSIVGIPGTLLLALTEP